MKKIGLTLLIVTLFCKTAAAFSVTHKFNINIGPFDASRTNFSYAFETNTFEVNSSVETFGVFDKFYPFNANYKTVGKIENNSLLPLNYQYKSQTRFNKRSKELVYDNNGTLLYRKSSKNERNKKVSISADKKNYGTTDFQSVFAKLAKQYNKLRFCDSRMPVFDGTRRFDVIFKDEGKENLPLIDNSPFSGKAVKCSMYIDKLKNNDDDMLMQISAERPIYFWIMERDGKPFIARIRINETPLGTLDAYATDIQIKD